MGVGEIDVGIVGQNVDNDGGVFVGAGTVHIGDRAVVGAGDSYRRRRGAGIAIRIGDRVFEGVDRRLTLCQRIKTRIGRIGECPVRVEDDGAQRRTAGQGDILYIVGHFVGAVTVVGEDIAADGVVFVNGKTVVYGRHRFIGGIRFDAIDRYAKSFPVADRQSKSRKLKRDVVGFTGVLVDVINEELAVSGEIVLEYGVEPLVQGHLDQQRIRAGAAVVDVCCTDVFGNVVDGEIVAGSAFDVIAAGATINDIIARSGIDRVIAGAAIDGIVPRPGDQLVVAGAAVQRIVTAAADEFVVAVAAAQRVVAGTADEFVVAVTATQRIVVGDPTRGTVFSSHLTGPRSKLTRACLRLYRKAKLREKSHPPAQ